MPFRCTRPSDDAHWHNVDRWRSEHQIGQAIRPTLPPSSQAAGNIQPVMPSVITKHDHDGLLNIVLTEDDVPLMPAVDVIDLRPGPLQPSTALLDVPITAAIAHLHVNHIPAVALAEYWDVPTRTKAVSMCFSETDPKDVDSMANLYNSELIAIVDRLLPLSTSTIWSHPSDPRFDDDCRKAKHCCRCL